MQVLIVDNHPIVRGGLVALLSAEPDIEVVGEANDGLTAVDATLRLHPDVVLMDLSMQGIDGVEATRRIKKARAETKILMLSAHRQTSQIQSAIAAGASGYVLKRTAAHGLVSALRLVAAGGTFLDPSIGVSVFFATANPDPGQVALSQREAEVVKLIARGHSMKEIAATLDVSARTLETYKTRAMLKLGFTSRSELVRYAHLRGWLEE